MFDPTDEFLIQGTRNLERDPKFAYLVSSDVLITLVWGLPTVRTTIEYGEFQESGTQPKIPDLNLNLNLIPSIRFKVPWYTQLL